MQMIREHTGQQLETWLSSVEASTLPEFKSFAKGIHHDKAAVLAGLTLILPRISGTVKSSDRLFQKEEKGHAKGSKDLYDRV